MSDKEKTCLLSELAVGEEAIFDGYCDSMSKVYQDRLADMGFIGGVKVACVRRLPFKGPLMLRMFSSIYSLGLELASQLRVKRLDQGSC